MMESEDETTRPSDQPEPPADTAPRRSPERVADVALGVGATAFDWLEKAAKGVDDAVRRLVDDAPAVLDELEERGRPVREKLGEWLPGRTPGTPVQTPGESAARAAEDDIALLEARVRELERQVPEPETGAVEISDVPSAAAGESNPAPVAEAAETLPDPAIAPGPTDLPAVDSETTA